MKINVKIKPTPMPTSGKIIKRDGFHPLMAIPLWSISFIVVVYWVLAAMSVYK